MSKRKRQKTQVEMAENLAYKIANNPPCKNLVLSVEERFIEFVQYGSCSGDLELEPMDQYSRHLVHCLADIYELYHESIGDGDERHLRLTRGSKMLPPISVSDYLGVLQGRSDSEGTTLDFIFRYDGFMVTQSNGSAEYIGGETKMRSCSTTTSYNQFMKTLEEVSGTVANKTKISFRNYVSGYACKIDGVSDYTSMMDANKKKLSEAVIIWIFKEDKEAMKEAGADKVSDSTEGTEVSLSLSLNEKPS